MKVRRGKEQEDEDGSNGLHGVGQGVASSEWRADVNATCRSHLCEEGVCPTLGADGGRGTMTGHHLHMIAQRQEFVANPGEEKIPIAARQIPSTDPARKKNVAAEEHRCCRWLKNRGCRDNAGHLEDPKSHALEIDRFGLSNEKICGHRLNLPAETEPLEKPGSVRGGMVSRW
jgi:hypothetical protein